MTTATMIVTKIATPDLWIVVNTALRRLDDTLPHMVIERQEHRPNRCSSANSVSERPVQDSERRWLSNSGQGSRMGN